MAISLGSHGGRGGRRSGPGTLSEINIIPLVDVVLVLLIIFMLTASVMEFGMEVEVPKTRTTQSDTKNLPVVSVSKTGDLYLNEKPANINELPADIRQRFGQQAVYVRADKAATWDVVAQVLASLGEAKIPISVVTRPEEAPARRR